MGNNSNCAQFFLKNKILTKLSLFIMAMTLVFGFSAHAGYSKREIKCMALNIYFETRGEPLLGKVAVGMVTMNRVRSAYFPNSICAVVYSQSQFSWTIDKYSDVPKQGETWNEIMTLANQIVSGQIKNDPTGKASHFYNPQKAAPRWARKFKKTAIIGNHVFCQMPGFLASFAQNKSNHKKVEIEGETDYGQLYNLSQAEFDYSQSEFSEFIDYVDALPDATEELNNSTEQMNFTVEPAENNLPPTISL